MSDLTWWQIILEGPLSSRANARRLIEMLERKRINHRRYHLRELGKGGGNLFTFYQICFEYLLFDGHWAGSWKQNGQWTKQSQPFQSLQSGGTDSKYIILSVVKSKKQRLLLLILWECLKGDCVRHA